MFCNYIKNALILFSSKKFLWPEGLIIIYSQGEGGSEDYDLPRTSLDSVVFWWFPFVSCQFCTALPLYSVSDNWSSPQFPLENHVIPKILWLPSPPSTSLGDKSWLFPYSSLFIEPLQSTQTGLMFLIETILNLIFS